MYSSSDLPNPNALPVAPAVSTMNVANKVEMFSVHESTPPRSTSPIFETTNSVSNKIEMFTTLVESVTPGPQGSPKASPSRPISSRGTPTQPPSVIANGQVEVLPVTFPQSNSRSPSPPPSALRGMKSSVGTSQVTFASLNTDIVTGAVSALPTESTTKSILTSAAEELSSQVVTKAEGIAAVSDGQKPTPSQTAQSLINVTAATAAPIITSVQPVPSSVSPPPPYTPDTFPALLSAASGVPEEMKTETKTVPASVTTAISSVAPGITANLKSASKDVSDAVTPSTNINNNSAPSTPPRPMKSDDSGNLDLSAQTDIQRPEKTVTHLFDIVFNQTSSQSAGMRISDLKLSYVSQSGDLHRCQ